MSKNLRHALLLLAIIAVISMNALAAGTVTVKILDCQGKYLKEIGSYQAGPGKTFLVTGLDLELSGSDSDSFFVDSSVFSAIVNGNKYPNSLATYSLGDLGMPPLQTLTLGNRGKANGYLAFEVPDGTSNFKIAYTGQEDDQVELHEC